MNDTSQVSRAQMLAFGVTIFTGAFLLFQVQPLIGKYILPWFGGTPSVWTTCLLFFQCLLLGGYAYAHLLTRLPMRKQAIVHMVLLAASLLFLPIRPSEALQPEPGGNPAWQILVLLAATIGLPYLVLSSTGPLIQSWFSRKFAGRSPYRLYALSNIGSMLALITYPFLVEPYTTRNTQVWSWSFGLVVFAIVCGAVAWNMREVKEPEEIDEEEAPAPAISRWTMALWVLLPACGTAQLMAATNKITQDVAIIPFLWVLPLSLYLLSFIICFDSPRWYSRTWFSRALWLSWAAVIWALHKGANADIILQVVIFNAALFIGCMICHGELYRLRPPAIRLTQYFLMISAGGALGGLFVALVAPLIFADYWEFHVSLWGGGALMLVVCFLNKVQWTFGKWHLRFTLLLCFLAAYWGLSARFEVRYIGTENPVLARQGVPSGLWLETVALLLGAMALSWISALILETWIRHQQKLRALAAFVGGLLALMLAVPLLWIPGLGLEVAPWAFAVALLLLTIKGFVWFAISKWRGFVLPSGWTWSLLVVVMGVVLIKHASNLDKEIIRQTRNFYGVLKIYDYGMYPSKPWDGHEGDVRVLARSLPLRSLASGDNQGLIRIWNFDRGETTHKLEGHEAAIRALSFSSDGQWLASVGANHTLRLWELAGGSEKRKRTFDTAIHAVACSPGGKWIAVGAVDGTIHLLELESFKTSSTIAAHDGAVNSLAFDLLSSRLVSGGGDGGVKIWNTDRRELITETDGHEAAVNQVAFGQNGSMVASAGEDGLACVWRATDGRLMHRLAGHGGEVRDIAFDTRDSRLATAGSDGVKIWDNTDGRLVCTLFNKKVGRDARAAVFVPADGVGWPGATHNLDRVATAQGSSIRLWNTDLHERRIRNGRITHGMQYTHPNLARLQTTYYGPSSGVGQSLQWLPATNRTIGVVGLGAGTIAAYGKAGDQIWFYDIDPDVSDVAKTHFTNLRDCERRGAEVSVVLGDARLSLQHDRVPSKKFDLLVLDAFSSDAIPAHLLTREAIEVYLRHMKGSGVIAIHVSNRHLNLEGVVLDLSRHFGLVPIQIEDEGEYAAFGSEQLHAFWRTDWIMLVQPGFLNANPLPRRLALEHPFYFKQKLASWMDTAGIDVKKLDGESVNVILEKLKKNSKLKSERAMIEAAMGAANFAQVDGETFAIQEASKFLASRHDHPEMPLWTDDYVSLYRILHTPQWWDDLKAAWHNWWD